MLPATLPSIFTGMAVGMGITWEVVVAAEMIAGKSGLGYFTWASYVGGNYPQIIIGMISIGIAGYLSQRAHSQPRASWSRPGSGGSERWSKPSPANAGAPPRRSWK